MRLKLWKMNPISRLRMRERSLMLRLATGMSVQHVSPVSRRIEQSDQRQQRRLARAGRPGNRHVLSLANLHVNPGQRMGLHLIGEKNLGDVFHADYGSRVSHRSSFLCETLIKVGSGSDGQEHGFSRATRAQ